jgi:hypothetical protein
MNEQEIRAAALISAELHIKNEIETDRLTKAGTEPISGYILNKLLSRFVNYIGKGEDLPAETFEYRIDYNKIGVKSNVSLIDFLLAEDHRKDPV